ncbi:MAG TPA: hypothetical protein VFZ52_08980, partial [Chryseolinea sp.]
MTNPSRIIIFALIIMLGTFGCKQKETDRGSVDAKKDSMKVISSGFVFEKGQPFEQCHASTVLHTR